MKTANGIEELVEQMASSKLNVKYPYKSCGRTFWVLFYWDKKKLQHISSQTFDDRTNAEIVQMMRSVNFHTKIVKVII